MEVSQSASSRVVALGAAFVVTIVLLAPLGVRAEDPGLDPNCWTKDDCLQLSEDRSYETTWGTNGADTAACGTGWDYCYPGSQIELQVHLPTAEGAVTAVPNLGAYVATFYRYAIRGAIIAAVIAMMIGGVLWMTSAGTGSLGKARTIIANAIIGLLIALGSFVTLETINPELVHLNIPRTRIIRPVSLTRAFCADLPSAVRVFHDRAATNEATNPMTLPCGNEFFTPRGTSRTCMGKWCAAGSVCVPITSTNFACARGSFGGTIVTDAETLSLVTMAEVCYGGAVPMYVDAAIVERVPGSSVPEYKFMFTAAPLGSLCGDATSLGYVLQIGSQYYGSSACGGTAQAYDAATLLRSLPPLLQERDITGHTASCIVRL